MEKNRIFTSFLAVLTIVLIFTFIDFLFHLLDAEYAVPGYYFTNKIIYGTIFAFGTFLFVRKKTTIPKTLAISAVVSILLQFRYFLEGYPLDFVFLFLGLHFLMLIVAAGIVFKLREKELAL